MKEPVDIQALFVKAAQARTQASFEDTKQLFLASIPASTVGGTSKTGLLTKKWIIMISIITTSIVVVSLFLPNDGEKDLNTNDKTPVSLETPSNTVPTEQSVKTTEKTIEPQNKAPLSIEKLPMRKLTLSATFDRNRIDIDVPAILAGIKTTKQPYRFPDLTEEETRENEKRKQKMVKAFVKQDKASYAYVPSGTILVDSQKVSIQAFIIQKNEVTNIEYKTFLFDLLIQNRKEDFLKAKPDQKKWTELYGTDMKSMEDAYFAEDAFNEYPVVNVSREGAEMYCVWFSQQLHAYTDARNEAPFNDVRLPYRPEWIYAANGGDDSRVFPWASDSIKNEKSCYLANHAPDTKKLADDGGFNTVKVGTYNPNTFGLYNMAGNVAEMVYDDIEGTRTAGTAGGSWMDSSEHLKIHADDPNPGLVEGVPTVGFRVVMTHLKGK